MQYQISGHSMYPILKDGDTVLINKTNTFKQEDIIVFQHPFRQIACVKQIRKIHQDGSIEVKGTTIESEDTIGPVTPEQIIGIVTCTL